MYREGQKDMYFSSYPFQRKSADLSALLCIELIALLTMHALCILQSMCMR